MDSRRNPDRQPRPGRLVKLTNIDVSDEHSSQQSRPSSSGSSDRGVVALLEQRRRTDTWRVIDLDALRQTSEPAPGREATVLATLPAVLLGPKRKRDQSPTCQGGREDRPANPATLRQGERDPVDRSEGGEQLHQRPSLTEAEVGATLSVEAQVYRWSEVRAPAMAGRVRHTMVAYLWEIGNYQVALGWRDLLRTWRQDRTLLLPWRAGPSVTDDEDFAATKRRHWLSAEADWDREFVALYDRAQRTRVGRILDAPQERMQKADLGARYAFLQGKARMGATRPQRVVAKEEMFAWLYGTSKRKGALWDDFTREIKYWTRWLTVTESLHRGIIALFPDTIKKSFVEQTLKVHELAVWLEAIKQFRPELIELSGTILPLLTDALAGRQPPPEPLLLENWDSNPTTLAALGAAWFHPDTAVPLTPQASEGSREERSPSWVGLLDFDGGFSSSIHLSSP
ncbi:hypothetical protein BAUCODRAFT_335839 [Baudoinia panamericana UAMH 10762]|uniref:Uncharacterized protein n=1 Tax=Baudoinia panamericana (strain UAMH 10762) TaxID=717646 RepID=M2LAN7_BAUPA|nr:uncharacterized protein BAUCODRAFT_335839 [Baudoinia panamericana UAMH 10762]EMC90882.1 hypothetical protein BAUCODRAFT_335839 [Baudoinia panamericana UAMH 10762]